MRYPDIILASASPRRRELLKLITPSFEIRPADVDETVPEGMRLCFAGDGYTFYAPERWDVTEAGGVQQGTVKSAAGLGMLLAAGIGDTMRVSLTADPVAEIAIAYSILSAVNVRRVRPEMVSCPTCSRCQVDLIEIADEVERRLQSVKAPIKVAVMGCVVNGPGEARDADVGVACGRDAGVLFAKGERLATVEGGMIVDELFALIEREAAK